MKARVKATGETIDVEKYADGIYISTDSDSDVYATDDLDFWLNEPSSFDYWTRLEHQAAIAAMQGLCANYTEFTKDNDGTLSNTEMITENARLIAHALVKKMKENEKVMH